MHVIRYSNFLQALDAAIEFTYRAMPRELSKYIKVPKITFLFWLWVYQGSLQIYLFVYDLTPFFQI